MKRKLILLNIMLLAVVACLGVLLREQWRDYRVQNNPYRIRFGIVPKPPAALPQGAPAANSLSPQAGIYNVIFERNLFSPNRTELEPPEPVAPVPTIPPMPGQPVMTGLTMIADKKIAFIQEPQPGGGRQNRTVQVGDTLMNFGKVTEIRSEGLVFSWGDTFQTIPLTTDQSPRAKVAAGQHLQATVITVSGGKKGGVPAPSTPPVPGTTAPGAIGPTIQISSVGGGSPTGGTQGNTSAASLRGGAQTGAGMGGRLGAAGGFSGNRGAGTQQYQQNSTLVDTPFGRVQRPPRRNN